MQLMDESLPYEPPLQFAHRTVVFGDVHQDLDAFAVALQQVGGADRRVTTGDFLDRGSSPARATLDALVAARVELIVGNHELAHLGGPAFEGMASTDAAALAPDLRRLVLDGELVAARVVDDVLCVHGGISGAFWHRHLRDTCGHDITAIAATLNRWLVRSVLRRDFDHPVFGALDSDLRGPFWAGLHDDLLVDELPPMRQVVGHTKVAPGTDWMHVGRGAVLPIDWSVAPGDPVGHAIFAAGELVRA